MKGQRITAMGKAAQFYSFMMCIFYLEIEACGSRAAVLVGGRGGRFVVTSPAFYLLRDMRMHQQCVGIPPKMGTCHIFVHFQAVRRTWEADF